MELIIDKYKLSTYAKCSNLISSPFRTNSASAAERE